MIYQLTDNIVSGFATREHAEGFAAAAGRGARASTKNSHIMTSDPAPVVVNASIANWDARKWCAAQGLEIAPAV